MNNSAPTLLLARYLIAADWGPVHLGDESSTVRWTLDLVTKELVEAQTKRMDGSSQWSPISALEHSNLVESIRRNGVVANPASFGIRASETLPAWSEAVKVIAPAPQPAGDIVKFLSRRQRSGRGPTA